MPNWSYNHIIFIGKEETMNELFKIGLRNSNVEPLETMNDNFNLLLSQAKVKELNDNGCVELVGGLTARTFLPMPDTYLLHDTTNQPNMYPVEVVEEQRSMGAVGWYDYNCLTLGTKWDFDLDGFTIDTVLGKKGVYQVSFSCDTAWSMPVPWMVAIKNMLPELQIMIASNEESVAWDMVGYIGYDEDSELYNMCVYSDYADNRQNDYIALGNRRNEYVEKMMGDENEVKDAMATLNTEDMDAVRRHFEEKSEKLYSYDDVDYSTNIDNDCESVFTMLLEKIDAE